MKQTKSKKETRQHRTGGKHHKHCNPKLLGQGPKNCNFPKAVRRGWKRSSGPRVQKSPKSLLHHQKLVVLHRCNPILHQCKTLCAPWAQATFCILSFSLREFTILKAQGTLMSESLENGPFPCVAWENRMSQGRPRSPISGGRTVPTTRLFKENCPFIWFFRMGPFARKLFSRTPLS